MKADLVEISRQEPGKKYLVRIQVGEEVIRRLIDQPKDAGEGALRDAAVGVAAQEGYSIGSSEVVVVT